MRIFKSLILLVLGLAIGWLIGHHQNTGTVDSIAKTPPNDARSGEISPISDLLDKDLIFKEFTTRLERGHFRKDHHWATLLDSLDSSTISQLIDLVMKDDFRREGGSFLAALFEQWGKIDPAAALARIRTLPTFRNDQSEWLNDRVYRGWAYQNVRGMAAWVLKLKRGDQRSRATRAIYDFSDDLDLLTVIEFANDAAKNGQNNGFHSVWAERDPRAAVAALEKLPASQNQNWMAQGVAQIWARQEPEAALDWFVNSRFLTGSSRIRELITEVAKGHPLHVVKTIDQMPVGAIKNVATETLIQSWAETDPQAAFNWLEQRPLAFDSNKLFSSVAFSLGAKSFESALQLADRLPEGVDRDVFINSAYKGLAFDDPIAALPTIEGMPASAARSRLIKSTLSKIGNSDPRHSLSLLSQMEDTNDLVMLSTSFIERIANEDLAEALELIPSLKSEAHRNHAILRLVKENVSKDPSLGAVIASALTPSPETTEAIKTIANSYVQLDPHSALTWIQQLPVDSDREVATMEIIGALFHYDDQAALKLAQDLPPGDVRRKSLSQIAQSWVQFDHSKAVRWATALKGNDRTAALGGLATAFSYGSTEKMIEFISELKSSDFDSNFLNSPITTFANLPENSIRILDSIPSSNLRDQALKSLTEDWIDSGVHLDYYPLSDHPLRIWELTDPGKAEEWIAQTNLPSETKVKLRLLVAGGSLAP